MFLLILLPTEVDAVTNQRCYKKNTVRAFGSGGDKMILTLLAKVIIFYMGLTTMHIR